MGPPPPAGRMAAAGQAAALTDQRSGGETGTEDVTFRRAPTRDTLAVAVYMGGGPSLMYAAEAVRAWEEFGGKS